jgi:hypothetical protein
LLAVSKLGWIERSWSWGCWRNYNRGRRYDWWLRRFYRRLGGNHYWRFWGNYNRGRLNSVLRFNYHWWLRRHYNRWLGRCYNNRRFSSIFDLRHYDRLFLSGLCLG